MTDEQPRALSVIVGARLRAAREAAGRRQADIAAAANDFGLEWGRSSVAALEAGNRKLSTEELVMLRHILLHAGIFEPELIKDDDQIAFTNRFSMWGRDFKRGLLGEADRRRLRQELRARKAAIASPGEDPESVTLPEELPPDQQKKHLQATVDFLSPGVIAERVWPHVRTRDVGRAWSGSRTELERKIADAIDADPVTVAVLAHVLWGLRADIERDRRTALRGDFETPRALQSARGHVTRELIEEAKAEWQDKRLVFIQEATKLLAMYDDVDQMSRWIERQNRRVRQQIEEDRLAGEADKRASIENDAMYDMAAQAEAEEASDD